LRAGFREIFFVWSCSVMGRRGPKPEPSSVKLAKGNSGHRPIGEEPTAEQVEANAAAAVKVEAPAWLKKEGLEVWERLAPRLLGQKLLFPIDAETFGRYCTNFARWLKMQAVLDAEGETYESESPHGKYKRAHPAYLIGDRLEKQLAAAEANFGLNPAERQRLYAARAAAAGAGGQLFGDLPTQRRPDRATPSSVAPPQQQPTTAAGKSAIGFLQ